MTDWADETAQEITAGYMNTLGLEVEPYIRTNIAQALRDAVAAKREVCARVAEELHLEFPELPDNQPMSWFSSEIAAAIRARQEEGT